MNKKGVAKWLKVILIILLIIAILLAIAVLVLLIIRMQEPSKPNSGQDPIERGKNPVEDLTDQEAEEKLNKTFVRYLLYEIKADELHNPPLSSDTPKINIDITDLDFGAEIVDGSITVKENPLPTADIKIITTRKEAIKMLRNKNHIAESFNSGASQIELLASKTKLFSKGYLDLYTELTGQEAGI
jgi:hypothetical protein